ncbi:MAG: hypothetical protein KDB03_25290 [Planctomycetales bacterium]|nr:hypothetical protein [Planctomycetales bacterium]
MSQRTVRDSALSLLALLWVPTISIIAILVLAVNSARLTSTAYWILTAIPISTLVLWKLWIRRWAAQNQVVEPSHEQLARMRPFGGFFLALYFLTTVFLGCGVIAWKYNWDRSWTFFVTLLSFFAIRLDIWAVFCMHVLSSRYSTENISDEGQAVR